MRRSLAATLLAGACLLQAATPAVGASGHTVAPPQLTAGLRAHSTATTTSATDSETPVPVAPSIVPPAGRRLSPDDVLEIAGRLPRMRHVRADYPGSYDGAYLKGPGRWQVSYFSRKGKEIGQVIISDASGRVLEQWTGFQVAWTMARGYPGAFGRHVNALYVWLPLCALFLLPFIEWRRPFALRPPGPAGAALLLGLACLLQPRRDLQIRSPHLPAADLPAWCGCCCCCDRAGGRGRPAR